MTVDLVMNIICIRRRCDGSWQSYNSAVAPPVNPYWPKALVNCKELPTYGSEFNAQQTLDCDKQSDKQRIMFEVNNDTYTRHWAVTRPLALWNTPY